MKIKHCNNNLHASIPDLAAGSRHVGGGLYMKCILVHSTRCHLLHPLAQITIYQIQLYHIMYYCIKNFSLIYENKLSRGKWLLCILLLSIYGLVPEHRLVKSITSYGVPSLVSIGEWHNPPPSLQWWYGRQVKDSGSLQFFNKIVSKRFYLKVSGLEGRGRGWWSICR